MNAGCYLKPPINTISRFDPRRLREDYVPTGYKPYGVKTRAVKGHEYGLNLTPEDKRALIAFLRTD